MFLGTAAVEEEARWCLWLTWQLYFLSAVVKVVAAIEAAHLFGWDKISVALRSLHCEWRAARIAFEADNKRDDDRDGVSDVDVMDGRGLVSRRLLVLLKSLILRLWYVCMSLSLLALAT